MGRRHPAVFLVGLGDPERLRTLPVLPVLSRFRPIADIPAPRGASGSSLAFSSRTTASFSSTPVSLTTTKTRLGTAATTAPTCTTPHRSTPTATGRAMPAPWTSTATVSPPVEAWSAALRSGYQTSSALSAPAVRQGVPELVPQEPGPVQLLFARASLERVASRGITYGKPQTRRLPFPDPGLQALCPCVRAPRHLSCPPLPTSVPCLTHLASEHGPRAAWAWPVLPPYPHTIFIAKLPGFQVAQMLRTPDTTRLPDPRAVPWGRAASPGSAWPWASTARPWLDTLTPTPSACPPAFVSGCFLGVTWHHVDPLPPAPGRGLASMFSRAANAGPLLPSRP